MTLRSVAAVLTCLLFTNSALAQEASSVASATEGQFSIGGGIAAVPRYSGSDQNRGVPIIAVDYSHASGFFASTLRGIGYSSETGDFASSAALAYRAERKETNEHGFFGTSGGEALKGMGEVKGSATAVLSLGYKPWSKIEVITAAEIPLSQRTNGANFHFGATAHLLEIQSDNLSIGISAGFATAKYAQTYYGVTAAQARTSQFSEYLPKAGLYEGSVLLTWQHELGQKWNATTILGATHLLRDAGNSPLTQRKTSPTAAVYISYTY